MSGIQDRLAEARAGDEGAFRELVADRRPELFAHCYRMLGSPQDAEDVTQEALVRAWRGLPRFHGRSSVRTWLYKIATNACLDALGRRERRVLPADLGPAAEAGEPLAAPVTEAPWLGPAPDATLGVADGRAAPEARYEQREAVELAFVAALQHIPPNQRAALILRDVLGLSARETAEAVGTSVAAVNSALQHARARVEDRLPGRTQQATLRQLGDARLRALVEAYAQALEQGDLDALLDLLTEDATWSMPPYPTWYAGHEALAGFLRDGPFTVRWRHRPVGANGQIAVAAYAWDEAGGRYAPYVIDVLELRGTRIAAVTAFIDASLFPAFGLPPEG
jgi:RNA polymerase sigma-70 factor (ECF subfamily)